MALKSQEEFFLKADLKAHWPKKSCNKVICHLKCGLKQKKLVAFLQQPYRDSEHHKVLCARAQIAAWIAVLSWIFSWWAPYSLRLTRLKDTTITKLRQKNQRSYLGHTASVEAEQLPGRDVKDICLLLEFVTFPIIISSHEHNAWMQKMSYWKYRMLSHPSAPQKLIHSLTNVPQMNAKHTSICHPLDAELELQQREIDCILNTRRKLFVPSRKHTDM